jgi:NADH-quinone oxidoreductase subunit E
MQATAEDVLADLEGEFEKLAASYTVRASALLALLHAVQERYGCITPAAEEAVAGYLDVGLNRVHEAVSFYSLFRTTPPGKYHLKVCHSLSCELCGSQDLLGAIGRRLGLRPGTVTPDGLFSLETVECLGCCDKAPALQINFGEYIGPLSAAGLEEIIDGIIAREGRDAGR